MKISKIFHFLYFSVLSIPLLSIPIFAIYSMNHEISGNSINTSGYEVRNKYETNEVNNVNDLVEGNIYHYDSLVFNTNDLYFNNALVFNILYCESFSGDYATGYADEVNIEEYNAQNGNFLYMRFMTNELDIAYTNNSAYVNYVYDGGQDFTLSNIDFTFEGTIRDLNDLFQSLDIYYPTSSNFNILEYVWNDGIVLDDEDIVSQFIYSEYNFMDKYLPMYKFAPFNGIYSWISNTFFTGNAPVVFTIFYQWFAYWLFVSLCWLIFDVLMYVPLVVHRWLDKGALE